MKDRTHDRHNRPGEVEGRSEAGGAAEALASGDLNRPTRLQSSGVMGVLSAIAGAPRSLDRRLVARAERDLKQHPRMVAAKYAEWVEGERVQASGLRREIDGIEAELERLPAALGLVDWISPVARRRRRLRERLATLRRTMKAADEEYRRESDRRYVETMDQVKRYTLRRERKAVFMIAPLWLIQAVAILTGKLGSDNWIHLGFYAACAVIYPVLIVAGFVEVASHSHNPALRVGIPWRALRLVIPATAGEMACLWALAHARSTTVIYGDAWASLLVTFAMLVSMVALFRKLPEPGEP